MRSHFEVPSRAEELLAACQSMGLTILPPAVPAGGALESVHDRRYLSFLQLGYQAWSALPEAGEEMVPNVHPSPEDLLHATAPPAHIIGQLGWYAADAACPIGPHTWLAASQAAACALTAANHAAEGADAYALVRPPGHHAGRARAGGHCYLNNAALAAQRLRDRGASKVAILDIDSHHGNGTQSIFWDRGDILFVSVHADPSGFYPWFAGHADERGGGSGIGANLNLPLPLGSDDGAWLAAIDHGLDAIRVHGAEALVVSLGFDASVDEPLKAFCVTDDGFARAGAAIGQARLPTALVQEGGYAKDRLGTLLTRFLGGFGR